MNRTSQLIAIVGMCFSHICAAQTPHTLLSNNTSEDAQKALEIMMKDPTWVTKRDSMQQTPLHIAASRDHTSVVKWLLENHADVDSQAYNQFTPLHLTKNPEIVRLILEKRPNLKLESVSGTAFQEAIEDLRHVTELNRRTKEARREADDLRTIVEMYTEYLGDDIDLISAVRLGQLDRVHKIVGKDPTAAHGKQFGENPLREAADWGHFEICKYLIEKHKVDVDDFEGGSGYPIIKSALKYPKIVKYLIEQGADLTTPITYQRGRTGVWIIGDDATALHYAAKDGVPETVKILLNAGVDPFATAHDMVDKEARQTALEVASFFGRTDNAIAILEHPKFKNARPDIRQPTLDESLKIGSYSSWLAFEAQDRSELLDALITHGAKFNTTDDERSPIQIAVAGIHPNDDEKNESIKKMVSVLRKHGYELDVFSAVAIGDVDAMANLLAKDPKAVNSYSFEGSPTLHMAIKMGNSVAVKMLLDAKCDIEIRNKSKSTGWKGETPMLCVAFWGNDEIAEMLIKAGADVNATAERQVTPLHEAVRLGNFGIAKLLLENGANKLAKDHEGKTPLDWASSLTRQEEFVKLFAEFDQSREKKQ